MALADRASAGSLEGWVFFPGGHAAAAECLGRVAARYGAAGHCRQPDQGDRGGASETIRAVGSKCRIVKTASERPHIIRFADDSPLEGRGFEPVWGLSC